MPELELDLLVLATGFDANSGGLTAIDIRDRDGVTLADRWSTGVDTHIGMAVDRLPNMLFLYGPQSATAYCNGPVCAEFQGDWVADLMVRLRDDGHAVFDETGPAWSEQLAFIAVATLLGRTDSWYMAANVPGEPWQLLNFPSPGMYVDRLRQCTATGYDGLCSAPRHTGSGPEGAPSSDVAVAQSLCKVSSASIATRTVSPIVSAASIR